MNLPKSRLGAILVWLTCVFLFLSFATNFSSCVPGEKKYDTLVLLDWNLHFGPGYDSHGRDTMRQHYEDWVNHYIDSISKPGDFRRIRWSYCPCDSSLANLFAEVGTSGGSIPNPPPSPKPGPTGDYTLTTNFRVNIPEVMHEDKNDTSRIRFTGDPRADTTVLAVIDTGLDTVLLRGKPLDIIWANNMLWTEKGGSGIFNVIPGEAITMLNDDSRVKHGTTAAGLALSQFEQHRKPRIMTIKAFDKDGKGSIYTVSCAMSYAIQKGVTAINASWGYDAEFTDPVLESYFQLANNRNIAMFAAAGNDPHEPHTPPYDPNEVIPNNELKDRHLFFPACMSDRLPNLVTVTGINRPGNATKFTPCRYQYYSQTYVNLGVLNNPNCCIYFAPFHAGAVEGSSFATPIATGQIMQFLKPLPPGMALNLQKLVNDNVAKYGIPHYTQNGNFIEFKNIRPQ